MDQLGFVIDPPSAHVRVLRWDGGGCRPAEAEEIAMWERIARLEEALRTCLTELEELNKGIGWRDGEWHAVTVARKALEQQ